MRNTGSHEMSTSISSSSQKNVELQETYVHPTTIEWSLRQHLQKEAEAADEEGATMQSLVMHRFLRAAKEVATDHESSMSTLKRKNHSKPPSISLRQQLESSPITHRTKSRAQQAPKGFTNSSPPHSRHEEDSMSHSISGFFCLGLKTALFPAPRRVSTSARSTLRKKHWAPHPSDHTVQVANEGTSSLSSEMKGRIARKKEAMGGAIKHQSATNTDVPVLHPLTSSNNVSVNESRQRPVEKYHASFSRRDCPSSDGCTNGGCNPPLSQSAQANLADIQFENMKSKQSPEVWVRNFACTALKEQEIETVQEGVTPFNEKTSCDCKSTCVCDHIRNLPTHELAGDFPDYMGGLETNGGKPIHEDGDHDETAHEPQFCGALSRLRSDNTFYAFGSPKSGCDIHELEGQWVNNEINYMGGLESNDCKPVHEDDDHDENADEPQLCDTLSRLSSLKSDDDFYSFVSPKSECEVLEFAGGWINNETDYMGGLETKDDKPIHDDDDHGENAHEPQFGHALSRLSLVKSDDTFYSFGAPKSECEVLQFEGGWINNKTDYMGGLETDDCKPIHEVDDHDENADEPQFCNTLSRLSSVKSNDSFYSCGSPKSECEILEFESGWINNEMNYMGGLETNDGKPIHEDDGHDENADEPQFSDALGRLSSVKSDDTFYSLGSSKSECEVLEFEVECINNEMDFTDTSSHFETPHVSTTRNNSVQPHVCTDTSSHLDTPQVSTSENNSVLPHVCTANEKGLSGKMSSLSQRLGKGLKLDTEFKQASKHDPCAYEQKYECQQAELQTKSYSRLRHRSFDSISGFYPSKASAIFPVFTAKCQSNMLSALVWPFGISSSQSSRVGGSPHDIWQEKSIDKYAVGGKVPSPPLPPSPRRMRGTPDTQQGTSIDRHAVGGNVPCPPLPPTPTESWLGIAIAKNASKTSPLARLHQKEKVASAKRKLGFRSVDLDTGRKSDFQLVNLDAERKWEDVVKGGRVESGHLKYSEELQILMRTSL